MSLLLGSFRRSGRLASFWSRSYLSWRDGTFVTTRATQRTNPSDGSLKAANVAATASISIDGQTVTMAGCWPTTTNLLPQSADTSTWALTDTSRVVDQTAPDGSAATRMIEGSAGTAFVRANTSAAFTAAATITCSVYVKRINQTWLRIGFLDSPGITNGCNIWFNTSTGTVGTVSNIGTGSGWTVGPVVACANGWWKVTATGSLGGAITVGAVVVLSAASDGSSTRVSAAEYGVWGVQLGEQSVPSPYIPTAGASVTHNADQHVWTPPAGWSNGTACDLFIIRAPYLWSAAAGAQHPSGVAARLLDLGNASTDSFSRDASGNDSFSAGSTTTGTSTAEASGAISISRVSWNGSGTVSIYQGGGLSASGANAINAQTFGYLGNRQALDRAYSAFIALISVPGGATAEENSYLQAFCPRSLAYAA